MVKKCTTQLEYVGLPNFSPWTKFVWLSNGFMYVHKRLWYLCLFSLFLNQTQTWLVCFWLHLPGQEVNISRINVYIHLKARCYWPPKPHLRITPKWSGSVCDSRRGVRRSFLGRLPLPGPSIHPGNRSGAITIAATGITENRNKVVFICSESQVGEGWFFLDFFGSLPNTANTFERKTETFNFKKFWTINTCF